MEKKEKQREDHLQAMRERLLRHHPDLEELLGHIEQNGPKGWKDMLSECDMILHEEKQHAVAHGRLHSEDIVSIEHTIDHWERTEKLVCYTVYKLLLLLQQQHSIDNGPRRKLSSVQRNTPPPRSSD